MPCGDAAAHPEDRTAYGLAVSYGILLAACIELSFRVVRRRAGFSRHQRLFIVLVSFVAGLRALAFALEPSLYPCSEAWQPTDTTEPGFGILATLPRMLFFCSYSVLVYTYLVDHEDFSNSRARDGRAPRRLAACLVACNTPGLIMQGAYSGALFVYRGRSDADVTAGTDPLVTVYNWYMYVFAAESLFLSVLFVGYGVALYTWYNRQAFFQDKEFNVFSFIDNHTVFKKRKHQVALASLGCSVAFITKGCLLLGHLKFSLINNEWHYELLSSLLGEILPALFMILMLRRPGGGGGVGGGSVRIGGAPAGAELQDLQEVLVAPSASGGGATA